MILFLAQLMSKTSFGTRMSQLTFILGLCALLHLMLNGGVTNIILLTRLVRQGCPLMSPLLFVIVTHPSLFKMHELVIRRQIWALCYPQGNS
jgi:hypothetical protein